MRRRDLLGGLSLVPLAAPAVAQCVVATFPRINLADRCEGGGDPPSLDLTFMVPGSLDPRITFTRASVGTYFDSAGTMQTATTNTPRWDYDPATLQLRGLLIEEARTNVATNSQAISLWANKIDTTVTDNSTASPDGTVNASLCVEGVAGTAQLGTTNFTVAAGSTLTYSVHLKRGNQDILQLLLSDSGYANGITAWVNVATGAVLSTAARGTTTGISSSVTPGINGWARYRFTCTNPGTSTTVTLAPRSAVSNGSVTRVNNATYYLWGAQIEVGAFPTSYIPTTSAAVTRAVDVATMPVGSWYSQTQGSLLTDGSYNGARPATFPNYARFDDGTNNNMIIHLNNINTARVYASATTGAVLGWAIGNTGTFGPGLIYKMASSWITGAQLFNLNGTQPQSAAVVAIPAGITTLRFGIDPSLNVLASINMRRVAYWSAPLSAADLQRVTA